MRKKDKITTNIAGLIKKYRKNAKLKQQTVANELHLTRQTISDYECEKVGVPASALLSFAALYKIPLEELLYALCNNQDEIDYVNDNFPNANDPVTNLLLKYLCDKKISYADAEFLYEHDDDGQAIREAISFQKAVQKKADRQTNKS